MSNLVTRAIVTATEAHAGQFDKSGDLYIFHPLRVMERVRRDHDLETLQLDREVAMATAVLHDVVEDTDLMLDHIYQDFGVEVMEAVDGMTKRKGERYVEFVQRAMQNPYSKIVKWHDIKDNSDPVRLYLLDEATRNRLMRKYSLGLQEFIK